ncbi:hypothetical protein COU56_01985 [Candidatus Pacearchaeota archaeon CG10_big_fil_rev_8_21_14_0_10_31_9]|nr:MAG: hypothetical protein AUJ62_03565 [Candidatus Pacearchaeota archaeon CG1_02_32_21]PIN95325.1 MAG: hypothetical protein COU56_01985 [Candidatus Pacearchaeota archaeon CG10_big_fil_rev_8_21_14_0_10_31_9]
MMGAKGKRGQEGEPKSFLIGGIIGALFLIIIVIAFLYWSDWGSQVLGTNTPEDLDIKYKSCKVSYNTQGGTFRNSFCEKFDSVGGSLFSGSKNYISCQYRPMIERLYNDEDNIINAATLTAAAEEVNKFCATSTVSGAENGDELVFSSSFCNVQKIGNARFDGIWANGFVFDKDCKVTTYPDWYEQPEKPLSDFVNDNGRISIEAFTSGGTYKLAGVDGIITGNSQASTFVPNNGSNGVDITQENIVRLEAVGSSIMPRI